MPEGEFHKTVLPSGLTVVTERMPDRASVSVGVWLRHGARDEPAARLGISHFIEHMLFKGTESRDARAIALSLESRGGQLDAFTAREQVCYFARALSADLDEVVDVLADITCRSRFAEPDVSREREVVREEILACEDNPEDKVAELLSADVWGGHDLGRPILGTAETLAHIDSGALRAYFESRYRPEYLVLAGAGGLEHGAFVALAERCFAPPRGAWLPPSEAPLAFRPSVRHEARPELQQLYLSLGGRAVAYAAPERYALVVLNALLGGGMSSRLFQSVREEAGLAYSIYSAVDFHREAGMFSIHLAVAPDRGREALGRVRDELARLAREGPSDDEVEAAHAQLCGSILIGDESVSNRMHAIAYEEIYCGRFTSSAAQLAAIQAVTRDEVAELARRLASPAAFSLVALGPADGAPLGPADWPGALALP